MKFGKCWKVGVPRLNIEFECLQILNLKNLNFENFEIWKCENLNKWKLKMKFGNSKIGNFEI